MNWILMWCSYKINDVKVNVIQNAPLVLILSSPPPPTAAPHRVHLSLPFQQRDWVTRCNEDLLPEITVCNVIGAHICPGSLRVDWATAAQRSTAQNPTGTAAQLWNQPLTWCAKSDSLSHLIGPTKGRTRKWGLQVTDESASAFPARRPSREPLKWTGCEETWDG